MSGFEPLRVKVTLTRVRESLGNRVLVEAEASNCVICPDLLLSQSLDVLVASLLPSTV